MMTMMRHINQIAYTLFLTAIALWTMTSCEGSDIYTVDAPDWVDDKINSVKNGTYDEDPLPANMVTDDYAIGAVDFSTPFDTEYSKYYQIAQGEKWVAQFELNINPSKTTTVWQNVALELSNDVAKGDPGYYWYGTMRFDNASGSQWGTIDEQFVESNLVLVPVNNIDVNVQKLGGKVTLTIDRTSRDSVNIKLSNGKVRKTYKQPYFWQNKNADPTNTNIRCRLTVDHSYINFLSTNKKAVEIPTVQSLTVTQMPVKTDYCIYVSEALGAGYPFDPTGMEVTANYTDGKTQVVDVKQLTFSAIPAVPGTQAVTVKYEKVTTTVNVNVTASPVTKSTPTPAVLGPTDNSGDWWMYFSDDVKVPSGETHQIDFTNHAPGTAYYQNFSLVLRKLDKTEFCVVRSDNFGWKYGDNPIPGCIYSIETGRSWDAWCAAMKKAEVTVYITNCGDGTADIQCVMRGNDGNTYYQCYRNIAVDASDLYYSFVIDHCHLEFK